MPISPQVRRVLGRATNSTRTVAVVGLLVAALIVVALVGIRTEARAAEGDISLFAGQPVASATSDEARPVNLGVRFSVANDATLVGLRFYRTPRQTSEYVGSLWGQDGRLLARATFAASRASGWQTANVPSPVRLTGGQAYVASYFAADGGYAYVTRGFVAPTVKDGVTVPASGGVYRYGSGSAFPTSSYRATNYLVDVVVSSNTPGPSTSGTPGTPTTSSTPAPPPSSETLPTATVKPSASAPQTGAPGGVCPSGQVGTPPACVPAPPATPAPGKSWRLTFNDDFDGSALSSARWATCFDWNYGACADSPNQGRERYNSSQIQVRDGVGRLIAEPLSPSASSNGCYQGRCDYKSGVISTARLRADDGSAYRYSFTYGYVESRVKLTSKKGFFSAVWLLPNNPSYGYDTEIDVAEVLGGNPDTVFMTYHYSGRAKSSTPNRGNHNNGACAVKDYTKDFVRLGVDWQRNHIAWYIDGVKCGQFDGDTSTIEDSPMHLILNVMVDNAWQRDWTLTSSAGASDEMQVDYVRVFQQG